MQSVVDISFDVIQRFNPSRKEIEELINKLNLIIAPKENKPVEMSETDLNVQGFEKWFKSKLYAP